MLLQHEVRRRRTTRRSGQARADADSVRGGGINREGRAHRFITRMNTEFSIATSSRGTFCSMQKANRISPISDWRGLVEYGEHDDAHAGRFGHTQLHGARTSNGETTRPVSSATDVYGLGAVFLPIADRSTAPLPVGATYETIKLLLGYRAEVNRGS